jgi:isoquinoline 1-oxidoreductase beta subunit
MTEQRKLTAPEGNIPGVSRRSFLVGTAATGLVMGFIDPLKLTGGIEQALAAGTAAFEPTVWYGIDKAGKVTVIVAKADMGQHIASTMAQLIAEELECSWKDVNVSLTADLALADPILGAVITGGSWSTNFNFDAMLRAGAAGRMTLIETGAGLMKVPASECTAADSRVVHNGSKKGITYAKIVASGKANKVWSADELKAITLKSAGDYKLVGQPIPQLDIPSKVNGTAKYGVDTFLPGMVYGRPKVPPVRYGSTVKSVDDSEAKKVKGFIQAIVLNDPTKSITGWVLAVATSYEGAKKAADALKVDYDLGANAGVSTESIVAEAKRLQKDGSTGLYFVKDGDAEGVMAKAPKKMEAEYLTSLNIHAPMEPMNATVAYDAKADMWNIYTGNQFATRSVGLTAAALGVDVKKVTMHQHYLGGGFGRRLEGEMILPAALAAKELGKPVKVIYAREDDMVMDFTRPLVYQKISAGLDASGKIVAMEHDVVSAWPTKRWGIPAFLTPAVDKKGALDGFTVNGADYWYTVPNHNVRNFLNELAQNATPSGQLRSVAPGWTFWAVESFMDEIAHASGQDPVAMRLAMLDGAGKNAIGAPKLANVLKICAEKSGFGKTQLPKNSGIGIACVSAQERNTATWTACAAQVSVDPSSGDVKVQKLWVVSDLGIAVNPDGARAQMMGATLWGLSLATLEKATMKNGGIEQNMFDSYTPVRMADVPELDITILTPGGHPVGVGEPAVTVVAPAIGNAVFNATGARVRSLPINSDSVKAAMAAKSAT